ncbi:MAG: Trk system potassium transporter TrkA [Bacteroidales bacterium]|nr:Trk system potassium transporter TrkA [Candidatus Equibacterium intestinale]
MKIVIAGAGEVGCHLAKLLGADNHDITIIDDHQERLAKASENADVVTVLGVPTSISVLQAAKVESADLFVAVFPDKEQNGNIVSALLAKQLGANKVTARINNTEYLTHENKLLFTELGVDLLFCPEKMAAYEISDLVRQAEMSEFVEFGHGKLQLIVFKLEEDSPLIGKEISDFVYPIEDLPFRIVAISRDDQTVIPKRDTKMRLGDMVYVMARRNNVEEAMKVIGKNDITVNKVVILGGSPIGEMVAAKLEKIMPHIKLIEKDIKRCQELSQSLERTMIVNGDGRNADLLYEENVQSCDAFIALTSSSETNIMTCVAAKKMGVPKTIAEVENIEYIKLAESMGVDAVINKKLITASRIFRFTLNSKVRSIKYLSGSDAEAVEYIVNPDSLITKAMVKDIALPPDVVIGGVIRGSESFIAYGSTRIQAYDRVVVIALPSSLKKIDKLFL